MGKTGDNVFSLEGGTAGKGLDQSHSCIPCLPRQVLESRTLREEEEALLWSACTLVELELLGCSHEDLAPVDPHLHQASGDRPFSPLEPTV